MPDPGKTLILFTDSDIRPIENAVFNVQLALEKYLKVYL